MITRSLAIAASVLIFGGPILTVHAASPAIAAGPSIPTGPYLSVQGFETGIGDWTCFSNNPCPSGVVVQTPSGRGTLGLTAASGNYYAEVHNIDDDYEAGFGDSGGSQFGFATPPAYTGDFSQSIRMYVNVNWPVALYGGPGVWIDESPDNCCTGAGNYGGEHNFRLTPTGTSVLVSVDGGATIATITISGWYNFQFTFQKGANPTDLVTTQTNVFSPTGQLVGTSTVYSNSPGGPLLSQDLVGPGYVWVTVWPDGWANDVLGIDDVRADLYPLPQKSRLISFSGR